MAIHLGQAFLMVPPGNPWTVEHLYIVVSKPDVDPANVLVVNVTSVPKNPKIYYDPTCVIDKRDHPKFVTHPSWIYYEEAFFMKADEIEDGLATQKFAPAWSLGEKLLKRIIAGFANGDSIPPHVEFLKKQKLIP